MSRRHALVAEGDVTRAVKGAKAAGLTVARVEIDRNGKIVVICGSTTPGPSLPDDFETRLKAAKGWQG